MKPRPKTAERFKAANADVAAMILADPEQHGGEESGLVRWARMFQGNASGAAESAQGGAAVPGLTGSPIEASCERAAGDSGPSAPVRLRRGEAGEA